MTSTVKNLGETRRPARRFLWRLLKRLILSLTAVALCFFALDFVLRLQFPYLLADPLIHSDRSRIIFNPGSAGHPASSAATSNRFRIATIGDSFTVGVGVQSYDRFGARLQWMMNLNRQEPTAEVLLFASEGTSTFQQLALLEKALAAQPDLILLTMCLNDTEDWTQPAELKQWRSAQLVPPPKSVAQKALTRTYLGKVLYSRSKQRASHRAYVAYYRRIYDRNYSGWIRFEKAIKLFDERCTEAGVPLAVMIFPLLADTMEEGVYPYEYAHEQIHDVLNRHHIPTLDLLSMFRHTEPERMQALPGMDPHPSEIAHRIAAEALLFWLQEQGLIEDRHIPKRIQPYENNMWKHIGKQMQPFS